MEMCSVETCLRDARLSTEHLVAIYLRNENVYCQNHFDSLWSTGEEKRCINGRCNDNDYRYVAPNRFISKFQTTQLCHLCWLKTHFPSVSIQSIGEYKSSEVYQFSAAEAKSILVREKERVIYPMVFMILKPILGKDVAKMIIELV